MFCNNCNVSVKTNNNICPLCHNELDKKTSNLTVDTTLNKVDNNQLLLCKKLSMTTDFPDKIKHKKYISAYPITSIFIGIFVTLFIALLATDITLNNAPTWSLIIGSIFLIIYITIRNTILSDCGYGMRIAYQLIGLILLSYSVQSFYPNAVFASSIILPILIMLALIANSVFLALKHANYASLYVSSVLFSLLAFLPLILALSGFFAVNIPITICTICGEIALMLTVGFGGKKVWTAIKMVFHN